MKPETREHVLKVMAELGYVYNRGAANLRNAQSKIVGLVLNDLSNPFFAEFAIGVETVLQMAGYVAFMANTAESVVRQTQVIRMMREHGAGGIILCPALETKPQDLAWTGGQGTDLLVAIRRLPDPKLQIWLAKRIHKEKLTVDVTSSIVSDMLDEMGIQSRRSSRWNRAPGLRWRLALDTLEIHVQGADHATRVDVLKRFLSTYKKA